MFSCRISQPCMAFCDMVLYCLFMGTYVAFYGRFMVFHGLLWSSMAKYLFDQTCIVFFSLNSIFRSFSYVVGNRKFANTCKHKTLLQYLQTLLAVEISLSALISLLPVKRVKKAKFTELCGHSEFEPSSWQRVRSFASKPNIVSQSTRSEFFIFF